AYLHVGAMIGTMMVANVAMLIIPGQRKMVAAMTSGGKPDPIHGIKAKQRSVHNNYFTLPVLFIMISNHYAMTYRHEYAWAVLGVIMAAGVLIRHFFNLRHKGRVEWKYPAAGVALLVLLAVAIAPKAPAAAQAAGGDEAARFAQVRAIIDQRCVSCHALQPTQAGFAAAPSGVMLHTPDLVSQNALRIYQQTVQLKAMPLANLTHMTDAERAQVGAWFEAGAKTGTP
ncbi:MAG: urate hydroxylase PuuD, partial [Telluria sp.]